jgi:hypothetical protein
MPDKCIRASKVDGFPARGGEAKAGLSVGINECRGGVKQVKNKTENIEILG